MVDNLLVLLLLCDRSGGGDGGGGSGSSVFVFNWGILLPALHTVAFSKITKKLE